MVIQQLPQRATTTSADTNKTTALTNGKKVAKSKGLKTYHGEVVVRRFNTIDARIVDMHVVYKKVRSYFVVR